MARTAGGWFGRCAVMALGLAMLAGCRLEGGANAADRPGELVRLEDGRHINLRCSGRGAPTVILEAGFGGDSRAWPRVQSQVARLTRVCAYDRAGYGLSDPGPLPRDGAATARDLDQALQQAGIEGPYVLVGHSAGGLYARLFAARRPGEVAGIVFVDSTVEQRASGPGVDGLDGMRRRVRRCLAAAEADPPASPEDPRWNGCGLAKNSQAALARARQPAAWEGQLSELDSLFTRTSDQVGRIGALLEDVPVYVLTASDTVAASPAYGLEGLPLWLVQQRALAGRFLKGYQRTILSSHMMMLDRPEVVADAVKAMVEAARDNHPPDPLPASETEEPKTRDATMWSGELAPR